MKTLLHRYFLADALNIQATIASQDMAKIAKRIELLSEMMFVTFM